MHYKEKAICKLLINSYQIYIPLNADSNDIAININNSIKLCIIRPTRETGSGTNVIFGDTFNFDTHDYLLAIDNVNVRAWLIPTADLDRSRKSKTLSGYSTEYSLTPQTNIANKVIRNKRKKAVKKSIKKAVIKEKKVVHKIETNEDVLNLLKG